MKKLLIKFLLFLLRNDPALKETRKMVSSLAEKVWRGERKRSYALNVLTNQFADRRKDIALFIELIKQVEE